MVYRRFPLKKAIVERGINKCNLTQKYSRESALKSLSMKLGLAHSFEVIQHTSVDLWKSMIVYLPNKSKSDPVDKDKHLITAKFDEQREVQIKIREIRTRRDIITKTIINNRIQKPDASFVLHIKELAKLEADEKELIQREDQLHEENKKGPEADSSNHHHGQKIAYTLAGGFIGLLLKLYFEREQAKKMDDILETVKNFNKKESQGYGIQSALKATGNCVYGWGAWTAKKMKFW